MLVQAKTDLCKKSVELTVTTQNEGEQENLLSLSYPSKGASLHHLHVADPRAGLIREKARL